jgi:hypothetical protein
MNDDIGGELNRQLRFEEDERAAICNYSFNVTEKSQPSLVSAQ